MTHKSLQYLSRLHTVKHQSDWLQLSALGHYLLLSKLLASCCYLKTPAVSFRLLSLPVLSNQVIELLPMRAISCHWTLEVQPAAAMLKTWSLQHNTSVQSLMHTLQLWLLRCCMIAQRCD